MKKRLISLCISTSLMACAPASMPEVSDTAPNDKPNPENTSTSPSRNTSESPSPKGSFQFANVPDVQYSQLLLCDSADKTTYRLLLQTEGKAQVSLQGDSSGQTTDGTYEISGSTLNLSVPALGFQESSTEAYSAKGLLLKFVTPSLLCRAAAHEQGPVASTYYKCPSIRYIPKTRYQDNAFQFYADHSVKRRRWDELIGSFSDTLYKESWGVYFIEGDQFFMAFGGSDEDPYLTGRINADGSISINELEPEKGACNESN